VATSQAPKDYSQRLSGGEPARLARLSASGAPLCARLRMAEPSQRRPVSKPVRKAASHVLHARLRSFSAGLDRFGEVAAFL
jgi:hypothetical protein